MPYHSSHKFRHGNAVYSLKNAKDVSALKAVSQNLMQANLSITDGVYGILSNSDVQKQITNLKQSITKVGDTELESLLSLIKQLQESIEGIVHKK